MWPNRRPSPYTAVKKHGGSLSLAILAVSLVAAEWGAGTLHALRDGVSGVDSLWYHMPISAGFVQSGSVAALHNINNDNVIEFYPATSELLHAVSILLLGSDFVRRS